MLQSPQYRRPALAPSALEERAGSLAGRHSERLLGLEQAGRAQQDLKVELQAAMDDEEKEIGLLKKLISLFVEQPHTPLLESLATHHEAALQHVRALGHHIEALETDLKLVERDIHQLNEELLDARADSESARVVVQRAEFKLAALKARRAAQDSPELQAETDELESWHWDRSTEQRRYQSTIERLQGLLELNRELRRVMRELHGSLSRLHHAGTHTLQGMSRHMATLRVAASARDLAEETATTFEDLKRSVARACHLADENASSLSEHVDGLEQRMRILDAEAAARREAEHEVEVALDRVRRWQ